MVRQFPTAHAKASCYRVGGLSPSHVHIVHEGPNSFLIDRTPNFLLFPYHRAGSRPIGS
jgi:hypothetical protein